MTEEIKVGDWVEILTPLLYKKKAKITATNHPNNYLILLTNGETTTLRKSNVRKLSFSELPPEAWDELRVEKDKLTEDEKGYSFTVPYGFYSYKYKTQPLDETTYPFERVCEKYLGNYSGKPSARQHGGNHYKKYPIQPYEYCFKNSLNNLQSEAISYITRYKDKGGKQDLEKAIHTLELLIEAEYDASSTA